MDILGILSGAGRPMGMMEYLDDSSYDELAEIDLCHDYCRNLYHLSISSRLWNAPSAQCAVSRRKT